MKFAAIIFLQFVFVVSASAQFGQIVDQVKAGGDLSLIEKASSQICANPALEKKLEAASSCLECDKKDNGLGKAAAEITKLSQPVKSALQIQQELKFYEQFKQEKFPDTSATPEFLESFVKGFKKQIALDFEMLQLFHEKLKKQPSEDDRKRLGEKVESVQNEIRIKELQISNLNVHIENLKMLKGKAKLTDAERVKLLEAQYFLSLNTSQTKYQNCGMSVAEQMAIQYYCGSGYNQLNNSLRSSDPTQKNKYNAIVDVLNSGLKKLHNYEGFAFRIGTLPPAVLEQHKVGNIVTYPAFTSSSVSLTYAKVTSATHVFAIKSKTGHYVQPYSGFKEEEEVLFGSGTKFKVLSREESGKEIHFVLEEITQ